MKPFCNMIRYVNIITLSIKVVSVYSPQQKKGQTAQDTLLLKELSQQLCQVLLTKNPHKSIYKPLKNQNYFVFRGRTSIILLKQCLSLQKYILRF